MEAYSLAFVIMMRPSSNFYFSVTSPILYDHLSKWIKTSIGHVVLPTSLAIGSMELITSL
jgi:hypothetical protein